MKLCRRFVKCTATYVSVGLVLLVFIGPMIWILLCSFKETPELLSSPPTFLPRTFTLRHYRDLFVRVNFLGWYRNSAIVASTTAVICAIAGSFGAYSLYRCRYRGRKAVFFVFMGSYMFPKVLMLIPMYVLFSKVGLIDSPLALLILYVGMSTPFSIWILRAFFQSIPQSIEEAALVDGANRIQVILRVFVPLAAPGIAAVALNAFLMSWSEYLFASTLIYTDSMKTLPYGMAVFLQAYAIEWGVMMAGSVLIAIPPVLGFALAGKYFIQGLTAGGIKG